MDLVVGLLHVLIVVKAERGRHYTEGSVPRSAHTAVPAVALVQPSSTICALRN